MRFPRLHILIVAAFAATIVNASADGLSSGPPQITSTLVNTVLALSGDCTNVLGALTCLKTNNVSFASGATAAAGSLATEHISFQPGLMTAVSNAKSAFHKYSKASTVDNLEASAQQFSCTGNPTITMYECGTSTTCAAPTTIGSITVTAAGTVVDGTVSAPTITAGDYVAFAVSAGTCVTLDINMTAQVHSN